MTIDELFGAPRFLLLCIIVLVLAVYVCYDEYVRIIDIRTINTNAKWVHEAFYTVAHRLTTVEYNSRHERRTTAEGSYRAQFVADKNAKLQSILAICASPDGHFSDEMIAYVRDRYAKIHRNDMVLLISEFVKNKNSLTTAEMYCEEYSKYCEVVLFANIYATSYKKTFRQKSTNDQFSVKLFIYRN